MTLLDVWDGPATNTQARPGEAVVRLPLIDELILVWPPVAAMLRRATVRTGCYEPIDLLKLAMAGQVGIWLCETSAIEAALVTELKQYPRRRVLEVLFVAGGNMRGWLKPAIAALDAHAHEFGCSHIAAVGRPGWARACGGYLTGDVVAVRNLQGRVE